jgi:hypothetical protein
MEALSTEVVNKLVAHPIVWSYIRSNVAEVITRNVSQNQQRSLHDVLVNELYAQFDIELDHLANETVCLLQHLEEDYVALIPV